jgi:hypothetical protein
MSRARERQGDGEDRDVRRNHAPAESAGVERFFQSPALSATFGGGEANVAVSLAHFGQESWYVTRLPSHAIGDAAVKALRAEGVRTEAIVRGGDRVGIYFAEAGASQRASTVIYDRAHSAVSEMSADAVDWSAVLGGAAWLHVTGITPALGAESRGGHAHGDRRGAKGRRPRQHRFELSQEALVRKRRAGRDAPAGDRRGCRDRQRRGFAERARSARRELGGHGRPAGSRRLSRGRGVCRARLPCWPRRDYAAREHVRQ